MQAALDKFTYSHGINFQHNMLPYGISDSAQWFQMKGASPPLPNGMLPWLPSGMLPWSGMLPRLPSGMLTGSGMLPWLPSRLQLPAVRLRLPILDLCHTGCMPPYMPCFKAFRRFSCISRVL
jgi:hypothetical protein